MKIGFIFSSDKHQGGVHNFSKSILLNKPDDYEIVIIKYNSVKLDTIFYENYNVIELKKNNKLFSKIIRGIIFFLNLNIEKKIYKNNPQLKEIDLYYAPTSSTFPHIYLKKPFCFTLHDLQHKYLPKNFTLKERLTRNLIFKRLIKKATKIHCESKKVHEDIITFYKVSKNKIIIYPLPSLIDHKLKSTFRESLVKKNKLKFNQDYIFYPAKYWLHKNHLLLVIKAQEIFSKYNLKMCFTGGDEIDKTKLIELIEKHNASKYISVTGYVDNDELKILYFNSYIVCIPSLYESISIPVLEGFLFKKLVIASNIKGVCDQFLDKRFLFNPKSEKSFMNVLEFATSNNFDKERILKTNFDFAKKMQNQGKLFLKTMSKECIN